MEQTDTPAEAPVSSTTQEEITTLTDKLEEPPTQPIKDVQTFWNRLDSLLTNIEEGEANKQNSAYHSFIYQPERVNISSDSDISITQAQFGVEEQTYNNFRVAIKRPFLDVKSIQLLRASIPNTVTNIPDDQTTFWYYRLPFCYSGLISLSIPGVVGYANASYTDTGIITTPLTTSAITFAFPSQPSAGYVTYATGAVTGLAVGSQVVITGITPAGYSGTFSVFQVNPPNAFTVVNATTGTATYTSAKWTTSVTDTIDFNLGTINTATGAFRGNYNVIDAAYSPYSATIFDYSTPTPASVGTILVLSASVILQQPSTSNLYMNRLLPSYYKEELFDYSVYKQAQNPFTTYGFNRTFGDYQSVLTELQKCSLRDPAYDTNNGGTDLSGAILMRNLYIPGDITFSFNEQINKFRMTGNNAFVAGSSVTLLARRYLIAGYTDPNIPIKAAQLKVLTAGVSSVTPSLDFPTVPGASMGGMPFLLYKTLNMRLGFVWDGINTPIIVIPNNFTNSVTRSLLNRLRPLIFDSVLSSSYNPALVGVTSPQFTTIYTADTYADLVYTASVSLYADFTGGSTYDSINNTQLLACVPMNASNLGVTFYNTTLYCPLTKISDQIYEIEIRMLTDTGAPYNIPNSAIVSLELALTY